jgi:hypothetical protein
LTHPQFSQVIDFVMQHQAVNRSKLRTADDADSSNGLLEQGWAKPILLLNGRRDWLSHQVLLDAPYYYRHLDGL